MTDRPTPSGPAGRPRPAGAARARRPITIPKERKPKKPGVLKYIIIIAVLVAGVSYAVHLRAQSPDPHYVKARDAVADYEGSISVDIRDYHDVVYTDALKELGQVNPKSISAQPAQELASRIRTEMTAFHEQMEKLAREANALKADQARRAAGIYQAQVNANLYERETGLESNPALCTHTDGTTHDHSKDTHNPFPQDESAAVETAVPAVHHH